MTYRSQRRRGFGDGAVVAAPPLSPTAGMTPQQIAQATAPPTAAQQAAYNDISCPSGYSKAGPNYLIGLQSSYVPVQGDMCLTQFGQTLTQMGDPGVQSLVASETSQKNQSIAIMAAGGAGVLFLDGWMKLLGAAAIAYGFLKGAFIGGL